MIFHRYLKSHRFHRKSVVVFDSSDRLLHDYDFFRIREIQTYPQNHFLNKTSIIFYSYPFFFVIYFLIFKRLLLLSTMEICVSIFVDCLILIICNVDIFMIIDLNVDVLHFRIYFFNFSIHLHVFLLVLEPMTTDNCFITVNDNVQEFFL